jgi:hypothetical protein
LESREFDNRPRFFSGQFPNPFFEEPCSGSSRMSAKARSVVADSMPRTMTSLTIRLDNRDNFRKAAFSIPTDNGKGNPGMPGNTFS